MIGGCSNKASALAIIALAISPDKWAVRPASEGKVSKIPNVLWLNFSAYHLIVSGSAFARDKALFKKFSTSCSFPFLATTRATIPSCFHMSYFNSSFVSVFSRPKIPIPSKTRVNQKSLNFFSLQEHQLLHNKLVCIQTKKDSHFRNCLSALPPGLEPGTL